MRLPVVITRIIISTSIRVNYLKHSTCSSLDLFEDDDENQNVDFLCLVLHNFSFLRCSTRRRQIEN